MCSTNYFKPTNKRDPLLKQTQPKQIQFRTTRRDTFSSHTTTLLQTSCGSLVASVFMLQENSKRLRRKTQFRYGAYSTMLCVVCMPHLCACLFYCCSGDFHTDVASSGDEESFEEVKTKPDRRKSDGRTKANKSAKSARVKSCPGCGASVSVSVKECSYCDYLFTSKSMLITAQSAADESRQIRDTFPFQPERVRVQLFELHYIVI